MGMGQIVYIYGMRLVLGIFLIIFAGPVHSQQKRNLYYWETGMPDDCPFESSAELTEIGFTGRFVNYTTADTWYPSWAADGCLYSPYTDGAVEGVLSISDGDWKQQGVENTTTGQAVILGDDPLKLEIRSLGAEKANAAPYRGRYPCGSLVYNGVWYYGTYCLGPESLVEREGYPYNWPWLGPFVGFRISRDLGKSWEDCPRSPADPIFGENGLEGRRFAYNSWITGDEIYLIRLIPDPETINDKNAYEFYGGSDASGRALWTRDFSGIRPLLRWKDHMGCVTMTYNAPLGKYLLCVTDGGKTRGYKHTYLLESDRIEGPWKMVRYFSRFGEAAYFVNIPSKFISGDGLTLWLCYSANFERNEFHLEEKPDGSRYAMSLHECRMIINKTKP
jgi:hypothetical protein